MRLAVTAVSPLMASVGLERPARRSDGGHDGYNRATAMKLYCRVEIPKGSEHPTASEVGPTPLCPTDWCCFPDTLVEDGGPLEAMVCASRPGSPGEQIEVRPIALLRVGVHGSYHEIVLCVARGDSEWTDIDLVPDLPLRLRRDIEEFVTRAHSCDPVRSGVAWCSRDRALSAIDDAAARWAATANGRG